MLDGLAATPILADSVVYESKMGFEAGNEKETALGLGFR